MHVNLDAACPSHGHASGPPIRDHFEASRAENRRRFPSTHHDEIEVVMLPRLAASRRIDAPPAGDPGRHPGRRSQVEDLVDG